MKRQKIFISSFFALVFLLALSPAMAQDKKTAYKYFLSFHGSNLLFHKFL
jgi:hypothetical protein